MSTGILGLAQGSPAFEYCIVAVAVLLRLLTGLASYSGADTPPKFGDYEAQRHWMEITINTPAELWYTETEHNNVSYWPLDYPPLSGYQSWLCGQFMRLVEPASVALGSSRGYETWSSKIAMRLTVIASDLLVYFPAAFAAASAFSHLASPTTPGSGAHSHSHSHATARGSRARLLILTALLLQPALILIDHGHFQYNCIGLGLALGAAAAIARGRPLLGSVLFCASLNHKQMGLYYAPAFFAHLLGWALHRKGFAGKVGALIKLGAVVIATFALCWAPWLTSQQAVMQVLGRIFPLRRGLYEDYVSNFWCASSLVFKWRERVPADLMVKAAAGVTLAAASPAMLQQVLAPSSQGLLACMANSAFAFYMFSYQVHEKSILLPLLPLTALAAASPLTASWLPLVASFSMFPLLIRDGAALPYMALCALYIVLIWPSAVQQAREGIERLEAAHPKGRRRWLVRAWVRLVRALLRAANVLLVGSCAGMVALHAARELVPPPERYAWLYDRAFISYAFVHFAAAFVFAQIGQWVQGAMPLPAKTKTQ